MADYSATVHWQRHGADFLAQRYSRVHQWSFDGGLAFSASASPQVVPGPWSDPAAVDPEEAFVASLSSCHMLWFLALAAKAGWVVDDYRDVAIGQMRRDGAGKLAMTEVRLRPQVRFGEGREPEAAQLAALHAAAHAECFIARSVKSDIQIEPQPWDVETPCTI